MPRPLEILAIEPFYGGGRRAMIDTIIRHSRHRWTLLRLPPRRLERRLASSAIWFGEVLARRPPMPADLVFASDALNLGELMRLTPGLARLPTVVYCHQNHLGPPDSTQRRPYELVNLTTVAAASQVWFNSLHHLRTFLASAAQYVQRNPDLSARNPIPQLTHRSSVQPAPMELSAVRAAAGAAFERRGILVDMEGSEVGLLEDTLAILTRRGEPFRLSVIGDDRALSSRIERSRVVGGEVEILAAVPASAVYLSVRRDPPADRFAVAAMLAGRSVLLSGRGVYPELVPPRLHETWLHDDSPSTLASRLQDMFHLNPAELAPSESQALQRAFDAAHAVPRIDERLAELAPVE